MKVYNISLCKDANTYTVKTLQEVKSEIEEIFLHGLNDDEPITITPVEITEEEYKNLPEWTGP